MSYFADIIKSKIRSKLQYEGELQRAEQILEITPPKLEEAEAKIKKAIEAAKVLEEEHDVAQSLYDTYPDMDFTQYGLPEAAHKPLDTPEPNGEEVEKQ